MLARYFGISLSDIVRREKHAVPNIVINITAHLCKQGIDVVGIFRPNGNAKLLDKFRSSYDKTGDADLRSCADVMTVAALLKVFLRELPDGLIPIKLTAQFVAAQDICIKDPQECLRVMKQLLQQLPQENYATLKYLMAFLVLVTLEEEANKMSAMALAIVFGPAIFRCSSGFEGLKEQGVTNYITLTFIMKYDVLFLDNGEISPYLPEFILSDCCKDIDLDFLKTDPSMHFFESISDDADSLCSPCSPASPPFIDSESSETSSAVALTVSAMLQKAIRHAVCRHAFAEMASSSSDESKNSEDSDHSCSSVHMNVIGAQSAEGTLTRKTASSISVVAPSVDRILRKKPAATNVSNTSTTTKPSTVPVLSSGTSSTVVKTADESDTSNSSTEDYDSDESPPPPILPRSNSSKSGHIESKVTEQLAKVEISNKAPLVTHKSAAVSVPISSGVGKPRLPSPPSVVKHQLDNDDEAAVEDNTANFKRLSKQIKAAKKKIKDFEADFEEEHGYKPSLTDKMSYPDIKKCMAEVTAARKQIAELRTESHVIKSIGQKATMTRTDPVKESNVLLSSVENTLTLLLRKLNDKRKEARRPEEIAQMSIEDLNEEKICLQKALLHFEKLHGRPSSVSEKQLMHPLYERYRKIKRILERQSASDDDDDEDDDDDNHTGGGSSDHGSANTFGTNTFGNTSFVSASTHNTMASARTANNLKTASTKSSSTITNQSGHRNGNDLNKDINGVNLHTMSTPDLLTELERTQQVKKHLQIELHNYEQSFMRKYGRRLQREDRMMKESEYREYKAVKSKLKLLEALLDKRERTKRHGTLPNGL